MSDEYDPANPYLWGVQAQVYTVTASLPGNPNITPSAPVQTEQEKTDRLWRTIVDASQGNG